jgi:hypothetical protein
LKSKIPRSLVAPGSTRFDMIDGTPIRIGESAPIAQQQMARMEKP